MLIHIGYHKTGTTFLQTGLFTSANAGFISPWEQPDIRRSIVLCSDFTWDAEAVQQEFASGLEEAESAQLVPVMSDERLCGSPHAGGYDSARTAHRLLAAFPEAKILIGIREQSSAIYSTYQQYVRNGGGARVEKYLTPRHPAELPGFRFEHWEYHHLIRTYRELFSPERVLVLAHEELRSDADRWTAQIQNFVERTPTESVPGRKYPSLSPTGVELKRHANRLLFRGALNPSAPLYVRNLEARFEAIDHLWPAAVSARIGDRNRQVVNTTVADRYVASNRLTAEATGLDLASLGYDMGS